MKKKREEHTIGKESEATEMMKGLEGEREKREMLLLGESGSSG